MGESPLNIKKYASQILALTQEISFAAGAVEAIQNGELAEFKSKLTASLDVLTGQKDQADHLTQLKLKSLILDLIHHLGVTDELLKHNVSSLSNWHWYKQLKFSYNAKTKLAEIQMCQAQFDYTYEYIGNSSKLVHTPLTDKCYLTLTQGMD